MQDFLHDPVILGLVDGHAFHVHRRGDAIHHGLEIVILPFESKESLYRIQRKYLVGLVQSIDEGGCVLIHLHAPALYTQPLGCYPQDGVCLSPQIEGRLICPQSGDDLRLDLGGVALYGRGVEEQIQCRLSGGGRRIRCEDLLRLAARGDDPCQ